MFSFCCLALLLGTARGLRQASSQNHVVEDVGASAAQPADGLEEFAPFSSSNTSIVLFSHDKPWKTHHKPLNKRAAFKSLMRHFSLHFPALGYKQRSILRRVLRQSNVGQLNRAVRIVERLCPLYGRCELLPPLRYLRYGIQVAAKQGLATCMIPKNMSTLLTAILCYFHDKRRFSDAGASFYRQWGPNRTCTDNQTPSWSQAERWTRRSKSKIAKFVLVRNPAERYLSAFEHLCRDAKYCLNCSTHECVLGKLYRNSRRYLQTGKHIDQFPTHVRHFDLHFFPQSWRCDFQSMRFEYTMLHVSSHKKFQLANDLANFFRWKGVDARDVAFIRSKILNGRNPHSTVNKHTIRNEKDRRLLYHSPKNLRKFLSIFFFDYLVLGYPLPKPSLLD